MLFVNFKNVFDHIDYIVFFISFLLFENGKLESSMTHSHIYLTALPLSPGTRLFVRQPFTGVNTLFPLGNAGLCWKSTFINSKCCWLIAHLFDFLCHCDYSVQSGFEKVGSTLI